MMAAKVPCDDPRIRLRRELLEAAGVDTVVELGHRNAANLAEKMGQVNSERNLTNRVPSETEVGRWIEEAKTLPRHVSY